uniref:Nucleophosmin n=1 Tax=Pan troglodytes TaxID=9598 RepID=A0A2I3RNQ2_PANTR
MEDSMDMDINPWRPRNYLFGCELQADKDYHFKVDNDENETVSLGADGKDELHIVEAEAVCYEGSPIKVTLATLKMSVQPTIFLRGFEITQPVVLRLKCGSGPVHISEQHLVAVEEDAEEDVKLLSISGKWSAPGGGSKVPQKKVKLATDEDDDDNDEDDDNDDFDNEETEEKAPNGKDSKPSSTPRSNGSVEDIKAKMQASIEKGGSLPKVEAKFISYMKNCFRMTDREAIQDLWQLRKSL